MMPYSKVKFEIYLQALRALKELSAGSFLKLIPWNNPRMTWSGLVSVSCGAAATYDFAVFSLLQSKVLQRQELYTELSPSGSLSRCPTQADSSRYLGNLKGQSGKHNTPMSLCKATGLVTV